MTFSSPSSVTRPSTHVAQTSSPWPIRAKTDSYLFLIKIEGDRRLMALNQGSIVHVLLKLLSIRYDYYKILSLIKGVMEKSGLWSHSISSE